MSREIDTKKGFRKFYDWTLGQFIQEQKDLGVHPFSIQRRAMKRLRCYANLFNRDCRKTMLVPGAKCASCESLNNLEIDHIVPISKGGKNELANIQILCFTCNNRKRGNNG